MTALADPYSQDLIAIRNGIDDFIRAEVIDRIDRHIHLFDDAHSQYTVDGRFQPEVLQLMKEVRIAASSAGYYNMCVPEALGGSGMGYLAWFAAWEQIFKTCGGKYFILGEMVLAHWATGPSEVLAKLTSEAQASMLPRLISGEHTMCFGMSEPQAGSDAMMMKTRAVQDGDGWRISGNKIWTTNSPYADYCIVFAVTTPEVPGKTKAGISAFLIPTISPGFSVQKVIRMWGHAGGNEALLSFDEVRVEKSQLVGELNKGFSIAMLGVNLGRLYNAARAVGLGRWSLEMAFDYAKIRHAFGKPISEYQGVTFPLVDSAAEIHAAHLMAINVGKLLDSGHSARKELSMTKLYAMQVGTRAVDKAMQAHGAMGFTNEMHLAQAYLLLRILNIADGTNNILRRTIAKEMLNGDIDL
ncbi:MAG: acyl-CoA dehydrogenase family protein [Burkholderiaceae bacterium]